MLLPGVIHRSVMLHRNLTHTMDGVLIHNVLQVTINSLEVGHSATCVTFLFIGRHCETPVSPCSSSPCATGTCVVQSANNFTCVCPPGYRGASCDVYIGFCPTNGINPCMNDGRCQNGDTGFNCVCPDGFIGELFVYNIGSGL